MAMRANAADGTIEDAAADAADEVEFAEVDVARRAVDE